MLECFTIRSKAGSFGNSTFNIIPDVLHLLDMVNIRYILRVLLLLEILALPVTMIAGKFEETENIHIAFDSISGGVLLQFYGPDTSAKNLNLYRVMHGFRTTSIRSLNRNGEQYTELQFQADNPDDPLLLENIFTQILGRECVLRYDRDNDTLNLIISNAGGMQVNSHNGQDLLSPENAEVPMLMFVWPGATEIFEVDVSMHE